MQETLVDVPGGRIAVQSYGGSGRDVLFVHSVGLSGVHWRPFAEAVADRCRPSSLDLPGHAHSSVPMRRADDQWRFLSAAARGAGLDAPVLVAHDTSIWAATVAAIREPAAFSAVLLVGGTMTRILESLSFADDPNFGRQLSERFGLGETGVGREAADAFQLNLYESLRTDWMLTDVGPSLYDEIGHSLVFGPDDTWLHTPTVATIRAAYGFDPDSEYVPDPGLYSRLRVPTWCVFLEFGVDNNAESQGVAFGESPYLHVRCLNTGQFPECTAQAELAEILEEALGAR